MIRANVRWIVLLLPMLVIGCGAADGSLSRSSVAIEELVGGIVEPHVDGARLDDAATTLSLSVAVVCGEDARIFTFGSKTADRQELPDGNTLYQIGSVTKALTGLLLADAELSGAVTRDTPVVDLLGSLRHPDGFAGITLAQLASHHSGLATYPENMVDRDGDGRRDPIDPLAPAAGYSLQDLQNLLSADYRPEFPVGKAFHYSNFGSGLLGLALTEARGAASYHELLYRRVLEPLGMTRSWGSVEAVPDQAFDNAAQPYATGDDGRKPGTQVSMGILAGGGGAVTTATDMLRLLQALTGQRPSALSAAVARALTPLGKRDAAQDIGYSIDVEQLDSGTVLYSKSGGLSGFSAHLAFQRDPAVGVMLMTNVGGFVPVGRGDLAKEIVASLSAALLAAQGR